MRDFLIDIYSDKDIPQILDLLNRVFSKQQHFGLHRDEGWWDWKYNQNIFGKAIIIVAKNSQEEIIGLRALWPWELTYKGQIIKAYQPVDTVVAPEYQHKGLFNNMNRMAVEEAKKENVG